MSFAGRYSLVITSFPWHHKGIPGLDSRACPAGPFCSLFFVSSYLESSFVRKRRGVDGGTFFAKIFLQVVVDLCSSEDSMVYHGMVGMC